MINPAAETAPDENTPPENVQPRPYRRIMDILLPKLRQSFRLASMTNGDQPILWDAYLMATPNPMQPGNIITGLMVYISIPTSIVGQLLSMTPAMDPAFADQPQEIVDTWVRDRLGELCAARSQQVMDMAAEAAAERNGHGDSPSGLIIPGR